MNFEYDGLLLSDFGCIVCSFNNDSGLEVKDAPSITFETSPMIHGMQHILVGTKYEKCLTVKLQICKSSCLSRNMNDRVFGTTEEREIKRWLNRKEFLKLRIIEEGYENIYFEGSFDVKNITYNQKIIGFELCFASNRPYALYEDVKKTFKITTQNQTEAFRDISDEIGFLYPSLEITCSENCDLTIRNLLENRDTVIKNCVKDEIITMDYPVITSSVQTHKIQNDFNYNFFRIANTYRENINKIMFSHPCTVKMKYNPVRKVGV